MRSVAYQARVWIGVDRDVDGGSIWSGDARIEGKSVSSRLYRKIDANLGPFAQ